MPLGMREDKKVAYLCMFKGDICMELCSAMVEYPDLKMKKCESDNN